MNIELAEHGHGGGHVEQAEQHVEHGHGGDHGGHVDDSDGSVIVGEPVLLRAVKKRDGDKEEIGQDRYHSMMKMNRMKVWGRGVH